MLDFDKPDGVARGQWLPPRETAHVRRDWAGVFKSAGLLYIVRARTLQCAYTSDKAGVFGPGGRDEPTVVNMRVPRAVHRPGTLGDPRPSAPVGANPTRARPGLHCTAFRVDNNAERETGKLEHVFTTPTDGNLRIQGVDGGFY